MFRAFACLVMARWCAGSIIALRSANLPCRALLPKNHSPASALRSWHAVTSRRRLAARLHQTDFSRFRRTFSLVSTVGFAIFTISKNLGVFCRFKKWVHPGSAVAQGSPTTGGSQPQVTISGGDNVVSFGQIGGITARVVTINPSRRPELRILGKSEMVNSDGSHAVTIRTEVASPITPGLLAVRINADGLERVSIAPPPVNGVSMMQLRNVRHEQNSYSAEIPAPRGQYEIIVQTRSAVPIALNATF
jgi:hypothetical protein